MIVLFTDFGVNGPYLGQMMAAIYKVNQDAKVVNLFANAPSFNPQASSFLLAAYVKDFPAGTVFLCVVDPGVGSRLRKPVVVKIDDYWFVGPDNGLFDVLASRAETAQKQQIVWQPARLSASFHGRDLFAPVAAHLDSNGCPEGWLAEPGMYSVDEELAGSNAIIYIDDYGNAITGIEAKDVAQGSKLTVRGVTLAQKRTFADAEQGEAFWYENSNGLVEIAVNRGSAATQLSLASGMPVEFV